MDQIDKIYQDFQAKQGQEIGVSNWTQINQARVNAFADVTEDPQFIHIDPDRAARETPYGGTIAHGYLVLSLASKMAYEVLPWLPGQTANLNYGFNHLRFVSPVPVGVKIRGRFTLKEIERPNPARLRFTWGLTIETHNQPRPAIVAAWVTLAEF